jgi:quercetin dioxygenase-like cupin family protein
MVSQPENPMKYSRRELRLLLAALPAMQAAAQESSLPSRDLPFEDLPARPSGPDGKNWSRPMLDGKTHTGYRIEIHQTELAPGLAPHPPHHHVHEELILVWQGTMEVTISGKTSKLGPGSAAYVASGEEHGSRNVGTTQARATSS